MVRKQEKKILSLGEGLKCRWFYSLTPSVWGTSENLTNHMILPLVFGSSAEKRRASRTKWFLVYMEWCRLMTSSHGNFQRADPNFRTSFLLSVHLTKMHWVFNHGSSIGAGTGDNENIFPEEIQLWLQSKNTKCKKRVKTKLS